MKWIGQHIWDFISRFRSDVYLEAVESGTIASGGNLGLDSNNKIVKEADTGITDLHGAGVDGSNNQLLTDDGDGTVTSESNLTFDGNELTIIGGGTLYPAIDIQSTNKLGAGQPAIYADINVSSSPSLNSEQSGIMVDYDKTAAATGTQTAKGVVVTINDTATNDVGSTNVQWGTINQLTFNDATGTCTQYGVNNHLTGGDNQYGLRQILTGATAATTYGIYQQITDGGTDLYFQSSDNTTVDYFSLASGASGATTLATVDGGGTAAHLTLDADGDIILDSASDIIKTGSTTFVNNSGVIQVATQGTIDHDSLANFVANEHIDWTSDVSASSVIHTENITSLVGAGVNGSANQILTDDGDGSVTSHSDFTWGSEIMTLGNDDNGFVDIKRKAHSDGSAGGFRFYGGNATAGQTDNNGGSMHFIGGVPTGDGTFGNFTFWAGVQGASGTSLGTSARIASLSSNGATSTDFYIFEAAGASTSDYFKIAVAAHGATTLSTIDAGATAANFEVEADGDITLDAAGDIILEAEGNDITVDADTFTMTSGTGFKPEINLTATGTAPTKSAVLNFTKNAADTEDGEVLGTINFIGEDEGDNLHTFATMVGKIAESDEGAEGGELDLQIASHDGGFASGLKITDGDADDEVDVTIANGAASLTTVAGNLTANGVITGKQYQVFPSNFIDDLNTGQVFIPLHGTTFEQSTVYQDDVAIIAPCDGRVVSVALSCLSLTGSGNLTIKVYTIGPNNSGTSLGSWTEEESESLAFTGSDDSHVFHFAFSNTKHFESTEKIALSIQSDSDPGGNTYWYATTVIEWDYSTLLGGTSAEYDAAP